MCIGRPSEIVLAENTDWRIRATGGPYASGSYWWGPQNVLVDFVVDKRGEFYATGRLYDSGPGDYSFAAQFPDVEWVNANVIRLHRQPNKKVPFEIRLHNASTRLAKWILLSTQEVFLVLEPEAGDVISLRACSGARSRWPSPVNGKTVPISPVKSRYLSGPDLSKSPSLWKKHGVALFYDHE